MSHSMQWKGLFLFRHIFQYWENLLLNMCECCNHMLRFEISPHWNCYQYLHIIIFLVRSTITALVHRLSQRSTSLALIIGLPFILGVGFRNIIDMRESILFRPYLTIMKKWVTRVMSCIPLIPLPCGHSIHIIISTGNKLKLVQVFLPILLHLSSCLQSF